MPTDKTLELGKQLAAALDEWDVLGRWMAHHVAELITAAETTDGDVDTAALRARAAQEILLLWSHRTALPRPYPFESFDRILSALDRFEDQSASGRLGRYFGDNLPSDGELAVVPILEVAARVDDEISDVVACLITAAVREAQDTEARWLPIAMEIAEEQNAIALRRLMSATRRPRLRHSTQESPPGKEEEATPTSGGDMAGDAIDNSDAAHEGPPDESTVAESDAENSNAEQAHLVEAIDRAMVTLRKLRSAVTDSAST